MSKIKVLKKNTNTALIRCGVDRECRSRFELIQVGTVGLLESNNFVSICTLVPVSNKHSLNEIHTNSHNLLHPEARQLTWCGGSRITLAAQFPYLFITSNKQFFDFKRKKGLIYLLYYQTLIIICFLSLALAPNRLYCGCDGLRPLPVIAMQADFKKPYQDEDNLPDGENCEHHGIGSSVPTLAYVYRIQ